MRSPIERQHTVSQKPSDWLGMLPKGSCLIKLPSTKPMPTPNTAHNRPRIVPAAEMARPHRERRTQPRGERTQQLLLDAAIECIVERGYAATSTREISDRAGISRGAQQHHFPHKAQLVSEAIRRLADRRLAEVTHRADQLATGPARIPAALDLGWESFSGDLFEASVELWITARTDPELRQALTETERHLATAIAENTKRLLGPEIASYPSFPDDLQLAINTMRGIAMLRIFQPGDHAHLRQWKAAREHLIELFSQRTAQPAA